MSIEIAGQPETRRTEDGDLCIEVPLTAEPDELLMKELSASPPLVSLCERIEPAEQALHIYPNEGGISAPTTILTAVRALIGAANEARAGELMSEQEREDAAAEAQRDQVQQQLGAWWAEQGGVAG